MMDNETERSFEETEPDVPPDVAYSGDEDTLFAPPEINIEDADPVEIVATSGSDRTDESVSPQQQEDRMAAIPAVDGLDIEGALAAVSSLSDMLAEEEAAEQTRLAQAEALARSTAEQQSRLEHPELFFPMPTPVTLHRGHVASVVPALLLILTGAWLTFTLSTASPPDPALVAVVVSASIAATLLVRWLASGRWARGTLFFALLLLLIGLTIVYLMQPSAPGLVQGWPFLLVAVGAACVFAGLMGLPVERRMLLPGLAFAVAGFSALAWTTGTISSGLMSAAASFWPVIALVIAAIWLLPVVFRQRR
jgi:hypothetical protein